MIGIIGALEQELAFLRSFLIYPEKEFAGSFEFISGKLEGTDVVLLRSGIGKAQAAAGCALLINRFKPELVINTGIAGGMDPALRIGDLVIADSLLYHDVDVTALKFEPGQIPGQSRIFAVPPELVEKAERAVAELKAEKILDESVNCVRGLIGSGDTFICDTVCMEKVKKAFPAIKAVEMESAAIAHISALFNVPALIIRSLSDMANTDSPAASRQFTAMAAKHSAEIVRRLLRRSNPWL